jgi:L,D-peptidoglycan transpeptidase YkuD (ErfK/YbiS/YcfS/YnhG family)
VHPPRRAPALLAVIVVAVVSAGCRAQASAPLGAPPVLRAGGPSAGAPDVQPFGAGLPPLSLWSRWPARLAAATIKPKVVRPSVPKAAALPSPVTTTTVTTTTGAPTTTTTTDAQPTPTSAGCGGSLPAEMASRNGASQLITVVASGYGTTYATLTAWQRSGACWVSVFGPFQARVGYSGITTDKHEGDGATPAGIYDFESTMYGNAPNPGVHFRYRNLSCGDWWDEDSASPQYNRFVVVPCSETDPPFNNGASEALWTETVAYPSFAVINYNPDDVPGAGSAIFLHADIGGPTAGCVSLPLGNLDEVLDWMLPGDDPSIVIGTTATITSY